MTPTEAARVVATVQAFWPRPAWTPEATQGYTAAILDLEHDATKAAVARLVRTAKFRPAVAEIREAVLCGDVPEADAAFALVRAAIRASGSAPPPTTGCALADEVAGAIGWRAIEDDPQGSSWRFRAIYAERRLRAAARSPGLPDGVIPGERRMGAASAGDLARGVLGDGDEAVKAEHEAPRRP